MPELRLTSQSRVQPEAALDQGGSRLLQRVAVVGHRDLVAVGARTVDALPFTTLEGHQDRGTRRHHACELPENLRESNGGQVDDGVPGDDARQDTRA